MSLYDVANVKARAEKALKDSGNPSESRQIFQEELMDWTDHYTENFSTEIETSDAEEARKNIANLWIAYCSMERTLKQWKRAVQVYEDALKEEVSNKCIDIYVSYADYCKERGKKSNAQKIYIRGLCAGLTNADTDKLWLYFLKFMHAENNSTTLTVSELFEAAKTQLKDIEGTLIPPSNEILNIKDIVVPSIDIKTEDIKGVVVPPIIEKQIVVQKEFKPVVVKVEKIPEPKALIPSSTKQILDIPPVHTPHRIPEREHSPQFSPIRLSPPHIAASDQKNIDEVDNLSGLTSDSLMRIFNKRPPLLFNSNSKEIISSGISNLSPEDISELETYLHVPLISISMGNIQPLSLAEDCLNIIESLWISQALKEKQFDTWFKQLRNEHMTENTKLQESMKSQNVDRSLHSRISAEEELKRFEKRCYVQRELLHAIVNKTMLNLLIEQERALSYIGFPRFAEDFADKLENYFSSLKFQAAASVSGAVSGTGGSNTFLSPSTQGEIESQIENSLHSQQLLVCALLSFRIKSHVLESHSDSFEHSSFMSKPPDLKRMSSVESDISGDWDRDSAAAGEDSNHRRRRKRRISTPSSSHELEIDSSSFDSSSQIASSVEMAADVDSSKLPLFQQLLAKLQNINRK